MSENYKEIVKKVDSSFEEKDLEGFLSLCAEDVVWEIIGDQTKHGKDEIRKWMSSMGEMEPPKITNRNIIAEGDSVAAIGEMTMKNQQGETAAYNYCDIYSFQHGKISALKSYGIKNEAVKH